jgi:undecaprenyl diphosphate synthase
MWRKTEEDSKDNTGGTLALCFNYGGLQEVTDAVKAVMRSGIDATKVTEQVLANHLYHPEVPQVDFMIRSSGEHRISNFMLWRMAYAELYFSTKHWPAFSTGDLDAALADYAARTRRFGS